jgi:hypothetical protein
LDGKENKKRTELGNWGGPFFCGDGVKLKIKILKKF